MTDVANIIEIVGTSDQGWTKAVQTALEDAKKIRGITGRIGNKGFLMQASSRILAILGNTKCQLRLRLELNSSFYISGVFYN